MVEDKKYKLLFNLNADDLFQFELHSFLTFGDKCLYLDR